MVELVHSSLEKNSLKYALHKTNAYLQPANLQQGLRRIALEEEIGSC